MKAIPSHLPLSLASARDGEVGWDGFTHPYCSLCRSSAGQAFPNPPGAYRSLTFFIPKEYGGHEAKPIRFLFALFVLFLVDSFDDRADFRRSRES
jgi:hypothetical protein